MKAASSRRTSKLPLAWECADLSALPAGPRILLKRHASWNNRLQLIDVDVLFASSGRAVGPAPSFPIESANRVCRFRHPRARPRLLKGCRVTWSRGHDEAGAQRHDASPAGCQTTRRNILLFK